MKKYVFTLLFVALLLLVCTSKSYAASAKIVTEGPKSYDPANIVGNENNNFANTFQIGLRLTSVEGTAGISYLNIRITYDTNMLTNWGGAFYNVPNNMGLYPSAGVSSEYISIGNATYYEGNGYLPSNTKFFGVNFKLNENVKGETTIRFEVISAIDAEGNSIYIPNTTHTINLGSTSAVSNNNQEIPETVTNNDNNSNTNKQSNSSTTTTTNKTSTTTTKSSNNYLKSLTVEGYEVEPSFDKNKLEYTIRVPLEINEVHIDAIGEDAKAKIQITGNKELVEENNVVEIKITAEDGSEKIYVLYIVREINEEADDEEIVGITENLNKQEEKQNLNSKMIIYISSGVVVLLGIGFAVYKIRFAK